MPAIVIWVEMRVCLDRCVIAGPFLQVRPLVDAASTCGLGVIRPVGFLPSVVPETGRQLRTDAKCCARARIGSGAFQCVDDGMQVNG